ncbi:hypothetical protein FRC08_005878 [Ceratobasidium sp. 394]|nr:hypothetical protein FRC08_005878 [Ceratobasidium sp. 394]KAG9097057.1 hypothetical protein FS749_007117 [Ceratobasidium sp. UAMH 11750]
MDRIKARMEQLRVDADTASRRAEAAEAKSKKLELELLAKEQEITSLAHRNSLLEAEVEKLEAGLKDAKAAGDAGASNLATADNLSRKVQLLEEELDAAEKNVKDTVEKLRQVDVKAEHFERQVHKLEQERDEWEAKYEKVLEEKRTVQKELDDLASSMDNI